MLIPGLPPAGTQQEVFKPDRKVRTPAAEGLAHEPLADLPVEEQTAFEHTGDHAASSEQAPETAKEDAAQKQEGVSSGSPELPRKGLLVDIRA